jgi:hypothetical protein
MPANSCSGANGTACQNNETDGLCEGHVCSPCNDPTDDATCKAAYPPKSLCIVGVCTPGDCRLDSDCTAGQICGVSQPNFCGGCTGDTQCQADPTYGANYICNVTTGACVTSDCTKAGAACDANKSDVCCAGSCIPGNCCGTGTSTCTGMGETCKNNQCTACTLPTNNTFYVDPKNGSDTSGVGSGGTGGGGCAFKTITRALQYVGSPTVASKIEVLNTATVGAGEDFPIVVSANVTIEGGTAGSATTVDVPTNTTGFVMATSGSALNNLVIDGQDSPGSTGKTPSLTNVTVQNMGYDGIDVTGGTLTIGAGVSSTHNVSDGILIRGSAKAVVTVNTRDAVVSFSNNDYGIAIKDTGSLTVGGTLNPAVTASSNTHSGLFIEQTPSSGSSAPPANVISNFAAISNAITGIHVYAGSSLKLRTSALQGNSENGIWVETYTSGVTKSDDLSNIDLGTTSDNGGNTLQYSTGSQPNGGAGICLALTAAANQTLNAAGNKFEAANCATTADTLTKGTTCTGSVDYAITGINPTNSINLTKCK